MMERMPLVRDYETVPPEPPGDGTLPIYALTAERIRYLDHEEVARGERGAEAARGARFRELYAMLGLRAAVRADGTLDIMVGATNAKGVVPCEEQG